MNESTGATAQVIEQPKPPINGNDVRPSAPAPEAPNSNSTISP